MREIVILCAALSVGPLVAAESDPDPGSEPALILAASATEMAWPEWYSELAYAPIDVSELCEEFRRLVLAERFGLMLGANPVDPTFDYEMLQVGFVLDDRTTAGESDLSAGVLDERFAIELTDKDEFTDGGEILPADFFESDRPGLRGGLDLGPTDNISGPLATEIDSLAYSLGGGP